MILHRILLLSLLVLGLGATEVLLHSAFDGDESSDWRTYESVRIDHDAAAGAAAPGALVVTASGGSGNASRKLTTGVAGETLRLRASLRREAAVTATVFTMVFHRGNRPGPWTPLHRVATAGEWEPVDQRFTVPGDAAFLLVGVQVEGTGRAWLDDLDLRPAPATADAPRYPLHDLSRYGGEDPKVVAIGPAAETLLALHVQEQRVERGTYAPYEPAPGDEIVLGDHGRRTLLRDGERVGMIGGPEDDRWLRIDDRLDGRPLQDRLVHEPERWSVTVGGRTLQPVAVHRKTKPVDTAFATMAKRREHWLFLELPEALVPGAEYAITTEGVNLAGSPLRYVHREDAFSESVHVSQVGFRPDDPVKQGFLSLWLGTGGGWDGFAAGMPFHLIEVASGERVYSGTTELHAPASQVGYGLHAKGRNFQLTDVFRCDFSAVDRPGEYRLVVDGVGASFPFPIAADAWRDAAVHCLRGYAHQRSGLAYQRPWAAFERPRDFHPDDGRVAHELTISELAFSSDIGDGALHKLREYATDTVVPGAWGGWHDAGDFDRRAKHQVASRVLFELLECHDGWAGVDLAIPERGGELPDLLDEALWGLDLFVRLQRADGAVRGGIETPEHPLRPDASFTDRLPVYVFAPDVRASWIHAATAAQAAWVLERLGFADRAAGYRTSALRAMDWAEATYTADAGRYAELKRAWQLKDHRHLAAVHCYRLTGEQRWHALARETAIWHDGQGTERWQVGWQEEAAFVYARLDPELADAELRAAARASLAADADRQIAYARAQAFDFTAKDLGMPLQMGAFSTPSGSALVRHHLVSGDEEALAWAIRSSGFALGANPMNTTFTTGLGQRAPKQPLYIDLWALGLDEPPPGITVFGNLDPVFRSRDWGWDSIAAPDRMVPPVREWPLAETWCDVSHWVFMNEFTIDRNIAPSVLVYGHLAGRE